MTNLTEQRKKGELSERPKVNGLPLGDYYIKLWGGEITTDTWDIDGCQYFNKEGDEVVEVLALVPSYEECQKLLSDQLAKIEGEEINAELEAENAKLKELLKECHSFIEDYDNKKLLQQIDEELDK